MTMQTIYPGLTYADAPAAIAWLERAFGCVPEQVYPGDPGKIAHAQLRVGRELVLLGSAGPSLMGPRSSPAMLGGHGTISLYLHVTDIESAFARAQAAGSKIVRPLAGTDYDDSLIFTAEDSEGYAWAFGTYAASPDTDLSPCLRFADAPRAIGWLKETFGFEEKMLVPDGSGGVAHCELAFGTGLIMCGSHRDDDQHCDSPVRAGGTAGTTYLYTADPDTLFARASDVAADIARPIQDMEYGSREFSIRDLEGNVFSFGTYRP
jgi:uncharacterized glyoxalase superfamily protein PhnB